MIQRASRRSFLIRVASCSVLAHMPFAAWGQSRTSRIEVFRLTDRLFMLEAAGINIVATHNDAEALMVDGGAAARSSDTLARVRQECGGREIRTLFNTHWHPEQTGCNERLGKAGAKIIAHENTRQWLGYANPLPDRPETYGPLPAIARPNETFYDTGTMPFGDERIDYGYLLQAHTDGDAYVRFNNANVLVAGDVVCADGWPLIDWRTGGWIGGMVEGLARLITLCDGQTRIVPGKGPVQTRVDLEGRRDMIGTIFVRLEELMRQGKGPDEALAARPAREFEDGRGDPSLFLRLAFESMWGHYAPNA